MYVFRSADNNASEPRHLCFTVLTKNKRLFAGSLWKNGMWVDILPANDSFMDAPICKMEKENYHKYYNYDRD